MAQWATFVGISGVVLVLLLVLSHLTQSAFSDDDPGSSERADSHDRSDASADADRARTARSDADRADIAVDLPPDDGSERGSEPARAPRDPSQPRPSASAGEPVDDRPGTDPGGRPRNASRDRDRAAVDLGQRRPTDRDLESDALSTGMLLANVAFSQGLFALVLLGAAVYTAIPPAALGVEFSVAYLETGLVWGTAAGLVFYVANELAAATATRFGFDHDEDLRELLSPDSLGEWVVLLVGVLPIIAAFEELLFRAALIGVPAAGFGLSPWLLAVGSSIAFALGHGMQGSVGVVVTGLLGFVLAVVFVVTGSLLVVIVAHYLVNALEFVVHEGLGLDWAETLES